MDCSFSGNTSTMTAAGISPAMLPRPPRITIDSISSESAKVKLFGATKPESMPYRLPAMPAKKLPMVKATTFQRAICRPKVAAAVSSVRTTSMLRPTQDRSSALTSA